MNVNEWMNRSFKNWLLVGAPLFVAVAMLAAFCVRAALGTTWSEVMVPAFWFGMIQIVSFGVMYFARKYRSAHNDFRPGILVSGLYCLAMGLLAIRYSVGWGLMAPTDLQRNYEEFTIVVVGATVIVIFLPLRWKL